MAADKVQPPVGPELQQQTVEEIEATYAGKTMPEAVRMYLAIQRNDFMGVGAGWFEPGRSRYDWNWLCRSSGVEASVNGIARDQFRGDDAAFNHLDRDRDGQITRDDLDWSDENPWVQNAYLVNRLFRRLNRSGDGKLTRAEWQAFYDEAAGNRPFLTSGELRDVWLSGMSSSFLPGDAPTREILLRGLFAGEIGSFHEGPNVGDTSPDFELQTFDGTQTVQLSQVIGARPVVLCFGNFTCGPFRSMYPDVDDIAQRYREQAAFLAVYVREAHPTDGWAMQSNERTGVRVAQPKTLAARRAVAAQCQQRLKPSIPLLVDDVNDTVGDAYSGMPARLYVVDAQGKVTYKGGRGPFGFRPGEMEQALVMTLLDQSTGQE